MSINLSLFPTQSGDYSTITDVITANDAIAFGIIYNAVEAHSIATGRTINDYISQGIHIAISDLNIAAIATLKAVGLITTSDNIHIALTALGYGFYDFIQEN